MTSIVSTDFAMIAYKSQDSAEVVEDEMHASVETYTQECRAFGGHYSADISLVGSPDKCDDWYRNGLGRRIEVYAPDTVQIWEGFVNQIQILRGDLTRTVGPLISIANDVNIKYTEVDTSSPFPLVGVTTETGSVVNADSQTKYGDFEKVVNAGDLSETEADQQAAYYLAEHAWPDRANRLTLGNQQLFHIRLSLLGFWHLLNYPYSDTAGTGTQNLSQKIQDILTADPNSWINTDYSDIVTNTTPVTHYEDGSKRADQLIKDMVVTSDGSVNRYIFGFNNNRKAYYKTIGDSTDPKYYYHANNPSTYILDKQDTQVDPWAVMPGEWLKVTGCDPLSADGNGREDLNLLFVDKVVYTMPIGLSIEDSKVLGVDDSIARWGLSGVTG